MQQWRSPLLAAIAGLLGASLALSSSAQTDMDRGLVVAGATAGFMAFGYWLGTDREK
jgi:hypothetical protein